MPEAGDITVISPSGEFGTISPKELGSAQLEGFKIASPDDIKAETSRQMYGEGGLNQAKAFGTAALETVPVLGGVAERALGVDPEIAKARAKAFPVTTTLGHVAGVGAQLASGVGPLAEIAEAGQAVEGAGLLGSGAEGLAGQILQGVGNRAIGSAVEGALYGAGNIANEAILGDPDLTAQSALSRVGSSALWGAGIGALFKLPTIPKGGALEVAKKAYQISHPVSWAAGEAKDMLTKAAKEYVPHITEMLENSGVMKSAEETVGKFGFLKTVEEAKEKFLDKMGLEVDKVFKSSAPALVAAATQKDIEDSVDRTEEFSKTKEQLNQIKENPIILANKMDSKLGAFFQYAPNTVMSLQATAVRAASFLGEKLPADPPSAPLSPEWKTSASDIEKFNRYYKAVENPLSVISDISKGTLTKEAIEAVSTVYPKIYDQMKKELLDRIASSKKAIPYQTKNMIGFFAGVPLTNGLRPENILLNQTALAMPSRQSGENVAAPRRSTQTGLSKLSASNMVMTPLAQSLHRRGLE